MKNQILDDAADKVRSNRSSIIIWILIILIPIIVGQIIAGPESFPFVVGIFAVVIFIYLCKKNFIMTFVGFIALIVLIVGFGLVKNVFASSPKETNSSKSEAVSLPADNLVPQEEAQAEEEPVEECHALDNFEDGIKQWCPLVTKYANEYGLDPLLVASVMQVESKGDQNTPSEKNAIGVMQVMPKETGWYFRDRPTADELRDPEVNIKWGNKILSDCFDKFGSLLDSVQCYYGFGEGYDYAYTVIPIYEEKSNQ